MSTLATVGIAIFLVAFGGGLVLWLSFEAGKKSERAKVAKEDAAAQRAAAEVMSGKRTPADAKKRLRDGTF